MRRSLPLALALLVVGPLSMTALGAEGRLAVSERSATAGWSGTTYAAAASADPLGSCLTPGPAACDRRSLHVDVPQRRWATGSGGAIVRIAWKDAEDDFDLFVRDEAGNLVGISSTAGTTSEEVLLNQPSGSYEIAVVPVAVTDSGYTGTVRLDAAQDARRSARGTWFRSTPATAAPRGVPTTTSVPAFGAPLKIRTHRTGRFSGEPTIGVDRTGTAFVTGIEPLSLASGVVGASQSSVLRSADNGRTWQDATAPRLAGSSPATADPYVHVDPATGRVFAVDSLLAGAYVSASDDGGRTWRASVHAGNPVIGDHQSVVSGAPPRGTTTSDPAFPRALYFCANTLFGATCSTSTDGGRTFRPGGAPAYNPSSADEVARVCDGITGHAVVDPAGRLLLPAGFCGEPLLAVSEDGGLTWRRSLVSSSLGAASPQTSVAVDDAGTYYYAFQDRKDRLPYLAVSRDAGLTWTTPVLVAPPGLRTAGWPSVAAGAAGRVVITFPGTKGAPGDLRRAWDGHVVVSTDAASERPRWTATTLNAPGDPVHRGECPLRCGNMYEFWDVVVSPAAGGAIWGAAVDTCTALLRCASRAAEGFNGASSSSPADQGVARDHLGLVFVQTSGPSLRPR
jgi:hypothetical protein